MISRHISLSANLTYGFKLDVLEVDIRDKLSQPFIAEVVLVSERYYTDFNPLLGQSLTLTFHLHDGQKKYINGIVTHFSFQQHQGRHYYYCARVEPNLTLLSRQTDCRIFQNISVPDIVNTIFKEHGFSAELRFVESYQPRVYCVQYRESQLNFVNRLLEEEGIYYSFIHSEAEHQLVLYDDNGKHDFLPAHPYLRYDPYPQQTPQPSYRVHDWHPQLAIQTGAYTLRDYNYKSPQVGLQSQSAEARPFDHSHYERYDYQGPEHYTAQGDGDRYARVRLQEQQCQVSRVAAACNSSGVEVGHLLTLTEHPNKDQNQDYLIVENHLLARVASHESGMGGLAGSELEVLNHFVALPDTEQYRPARNSQKQRISGPQTAVVVGPKGEEIYTDEHGRVKCQFHWDRLGKNDENSSCWIRVSQNWGGGSWGHIAIPRIGHEVIVDFLEGDPDQPIITGRTYNGQNKSTYELPANKTKMVIRSDTHKGVGFNELSFDDLAGAERILMHAQKDMHRQIKDNESTVLERGNRSTLLQTGDEYKVIEQGNMSENIAQTKSTQANVIVEKAINSKTQEGVIQYQADDLIHLKVEASELVMTKEAIVIKHSGSVITLTAEVIDQIANNIHLNKDKENQKKQTH